MKILARGWHVVLLALCMALAAGPAWAETPSLEKADRLIADGKYEKAVRMLNELVVQSPNDAKARGLLGIANFKLKHYTDAERDFNSAIALDPSDARSRYNLGATYFQMERWEDAVRAFTDLAARSSAYRAQAHLNAGLARIKQGRVAEGKSLLKQAAAEDSGNTGKTARRTLDALSGAKPPAQNQSGKARSNTQPAYFAWASLGREFDSNPENLPDAVAVQKSGWSTVAQAYADYTLPLGGLVLTPRYSFYGLFYDSLDSYNYLSHSIALRADAPRAPLTPRITVSYGISDYAKKPYMQTGSVEGRLKIYRAGDSTFYAGASYQNDSARSSEWNPYEGTTVEGYGLVGSRLPGQIALIGRLGYSVVSLADKDYGNGNLRSYSYSAITPQVTLRRALPFDFNGQGTVRYQMRTYDGKDVWNTVSGTPISKTREDDRWLFALDLSRKLNRTFELTFEWRGYIYGSNVGNNQGAAYDPANSATFGDRYLSRDFTRNVYGITLKASL